ncbi:ABC transporter substrate-binding protein [Pseudonocardia ailaonensis]|uniref:ABC transporter substrate-binding protein n=1 Tax=Pseudonocardia ailaonensis TaxID=367279 RepID=A0ABN2MV04_9PSEU
MSARTRLSRLAAVATGLVLLATTAACSSSSAPSGGSGDGSPVSGGEVTYLVDQTQLTLDPGVSPATVTGLVGRTIFDSLVVQSGPTEFKPWLATRWEISADGREYTFDLKPGVTFTDGTPFDANAVKATFEHIVNPASKSQYAASLIAPFESATVVNDSIVKITLTQPFRPFLQALSTPYLGIQSPKALALPASDYRPIGTGPFSFVSWEQQKDITLTRNPAYTSAPSNASHTGPAYLQTLRFNYVPEDATRYGALTSGQVQGTASVPPNRVGSLQSNDRFRVLKTELPGVNYNLFLNVKNGPTSDPLVRRAVQSAIDIPALVRTVYAGQYAAARSSLSPTTPDYDAAAESALPAYDPEKAKALLSQAGWTDTDADGYRTRDGRELTLTWPFLALINRDQRDVLGQAIQAEAKKVGIRIDRPNLDAGTYGNAVLKGDYNILDSSNARADADILRFSFASDQTFPQGGANVAQSSSPELDGWLHEAARTTDAAVAARDYALAQADVLRNGYLLPGYVMTSFVGTSSALRGVAFDVQGIAQFYGAWLAT